MRCPLDYETQQRIEAAKAILAKPENVRQIDDLTFKVRSVSHPDDWWLQQLSEKDPQAVRCNCPSFAELNPGPGMWSRLGTWSNCKHLLAVSKRLGYDWPSSGPPERPTREAWPQMWPEYNWGKQNAPVLFPGILRAAIEELVPRQVVDPHRRGRRRISDWDRLQATVIKVDSEEDVRGVHADLQYEREAGRLTTTRTPHGAISSEVLLDESTGSILDKLIARISSCVNPIDDGWYLLDSTELRTNQWGFFANQKYHLSRKYESRSAQFIVGRHSGVAAFVLPGPAPIRDCPLFESVLRSCVNLGVPIRNLLLDKGYLSLANFTLAEELGITLWMPKKIGMAKFHSGVDAVAYRRWVRRWEREADTTQEITRFRPRVEAFMHGIKLTQNELLWSKNPVAQDNEIRAKALAYAIKQAVSAAAQSTLPIDIPGASIIPASEIRVAEFARSREIALRYSD